MTDTPTPPTLTVVEQLKQRITHWEDVERHWGHRPDGCLCPVARNLNLDRAALEEIEHLSDAALHAVKMMRDARSIIEQFDDRLDDYVVSELLCPLDDEPTDINGDAFVADTPTCGGPDVCCDDLCRGEDQGICGLPSLRMLGLDDEPDDEYPDDDHNLERDEPTDGR